MKIINKYLANLSLLDKIIIALALFGILFFYYFLLRKPEYKVATIKVGEDTVRYEPWSRMLGSRVWFSELFHEGMQEKDGLGKVTAEILSIYTYDTAPGRKDVFLTTKLNATYNRATNQFTYKGKPLISGSMVKINFSEVYVEGMITEVEGAANPRKKQKLYVSAKLVEENDTYLETSGTRPYLENAIKKQLEVFDGNGKVIIRIIDVRSEDAKRLSVAADGRTIVQVNPLRKDIYITLEINALEIDSKYFLYDDMPILVGETLPINTTYVSILPEVTDIQVIDE